MDEPKTFHVWMPDGRSLCDCRSRVPNRDLTLMSNDEIDAYIQEQTEAPACGSCVLIADRIRFQAAVMLKYSGGVYPSTPGDAWERMEGTRWGTFLNLSRIAQNLGSETNSYFERIFATLTGQRLDSGVQSFSRGRERLRERAQASKRESSDIPE